MKKVVSVKSFKWLESYILQKLNTAEVLKELCPLSFQNVSELNSIVVLSDDLADGDQSPVLAYCDKERWLKHVQSSGFKEVEGQKTYYLPNPFKGPEGESSKALFFEKVNGVWQSVPSQCAFAGSQFTIQFKDSFIKFEGDLLFIGRGACCW